MRLTEFENHRCQLVAHKAPVAHVRLDVLRAESGDTLRDEAI